MINPAKNEKAITKRLLSEEPSERLACLEDIKNYIQTAPADDKEYRKIWKALFYSLWVADKPKYQNELSDEISKTLQCFKDNFDGWKSWLKASFYIFHKSWEGLDYWRTNKFLKLVRFYLIEIYKYLEERGWNLSDLKAFNRIMLDDVLSENIVERSTGLILHIVQIFVEVLEDFEDIPPKPLLIVLDPFLHYLGYCSDKAIKRNIQERLFQEFEEMVKQGKFPTLKLRLFVKRLLKKASSPDVEEGNRKHLYQVHKLFDECYKELSEEQPELAEPHKKKQKNAAYDADEDEELDQENGIEEEEPAPQKLSKAQQKKQKEQEQKKEQKKEQKIQQETKAEAQNAKNKRKAPVPVPELEEEVDEDQEEDQEDNGDEDQMEEEGQWEDEGEEDDEDFDPENPDDDDGFVDIDIPEEELKELLAKEGLTLEDLKEMQADEEMDWGSTDNGLLGNLPAYLFMSPAERRKHFNKLNNKYYKDLESEKNVKDISHRRKVVFNATKNKVLEFQKKSKVTDLKTDKKGTGTPAKTILKKTLKFSSKPPKEETAKSDAKTKNGAPAKNGETVKNGAPAKNKAAGQAKAVVNDKGAKKGNKQQKQVVSAPQKPVSAKKKKTKLN